MWYTVTQCGTLLHNVVHFHTVWHTITQCGTLSHNTVREDWGVLKQAYADLLLQANKISLKP